MKLRLLALGCGTGAALAIAAFLPALHSHSTATIDSPPAQSASTTRMPSGASPLAPAEPEHCHSLYKVVCARRGVTRDPTGSVRPDVDGELLALRAYEEIIRQHPDWTSEQVDEELVQRIYTPPVRARIESTFRLVRNSLEQFIDHQPDGVFTASERKLLKKHLRAVELQLPPPASVYADEPDLLTKNDVYYERLRDGRTRLRVGGAYFFTSRSYFNLVFTLGHELAHSIDPCELKITAQAVLPAYERLSACLIRKGTVALRPDRTECGKNDQLSETFADWFATQVTAEALRRFSTEFHGQQLLNAATNAVRDLCEPENGVGDELDLEFHPSPQIRIDRILGDNTQVRDVLGCAPRPASEVCSFETKSGIPL